MFWNKHRPGDQWNCKCWLEQTDAEPTAPEDMPDSADMPEPKAGLRGNPAKTKEIFSQDHPHFPNKCATCHLNTDGKVHGVKKKKGVKNAETVKGDCDNCEISNKCKEKMDSFTLIKSKISIGEYQKRKAEADRLKNDPNYENVQFNPETGALKATHINHNIDDNKGWYEIKVQDVGYNHGHTVILEEENHSEHNKTHVEGTWNGLKFEIAGKETATANNIRNGLKHCADKEGCKIAVLFFPNNNFNCRSFHEGLAKYNGLKGTSQWIHFDKIICIQNDEIIYEKNHQIN